MPEEVTQGESVVITGADNMQRVHWIQVRSALKLEIKSGMRHSRGSVMLVANQITGYPCRTKKSAYNALNKFMVEHGCEDKPLD